MSLEGVWFELSVTLQSTSYQTPSKLITFWLKIHPLVFSTFHLGLTSIRVTASYLYEELVDTAIEPCAADGDRVSAIGCAILSAHPLHLSYAIAILELHWECLVAPTLSSIFKATHVTRRPAVWIARYQNLKRGFEPGT